MANRFYNNHALRRLSHRMHLRRLSEAWEAGGNRKSRWYLIATLLLASVLLFLAFRGVSWNQMLAVLRGGRPDYLLLACLSLSVSYFFRGLRWRVLLSAEKLVAPIKVFWATMVGYLGNNLLPARAGELIRSVVLGRNANMSKSFIFGTILTERGVDVVALVLISMAALMSQEDMSGWLLDAVRVTAGLGLVALVGLFVVPRMERLLVNALSWLPLPSALRTWAINLLQQFLLGMRAFQHPGRALSFVGLTALIWLMDALVVIEVAQALYLTLALSEALLLIAALGLASAVPSTPGYVGVYQFVAVAVLAPFGFSQSEALAYIIAFQAMAYSVVIVWGFVGLWQLGAWGQVNSKPS